MTVTSPDEARQAMALGADALIVQGVEAGGHRGVFVDDEHASDLTLLAALQLIRAAVDVPLVAAGGLGDRRGRRRRARGGRAAAQVGTAYLRAEEAGTSEAQRAATAGPTPTGPDARVQRPARPRDHEPLARDARRGGAARVPRGPPPDLAAARPWPQDRRRRRDQPVGGPGARAGRGAPGRRDHAPAGRRRARGDRSGRPRACEAARRRGRHRRRARRTARRRPVPAAGRARDPRASARPARSTRSTGSATSCARGCRAWRTRVDDLEREREWLPRLAPSLSLRVPEPVAQGARRARISVPLGDLPLARGRAVRGHVATTSARPRRALAAS